MSLCELGVSNKPHGYQIQLSHSATGAQTTQGTGESRVGRLPKEAGPAMQLKLLQAKQEETQATIEEEKEQKEKGVSVGLEDRAGGVERQCQSGQADRGKHSTGQSRGRYKGWRTDSVRPSVTLCTDRRTNASRRGLWEGGVALRGCAMLLSFPFFPPSRPSSPPVLWPSSPLTYRLQVSLCRRAGGRTGLLGYLLTSERLPSQRAVVTFRSCTFEDLRCRRNTDAVLGAEETAKSAAR
ncbi:unnamed protein product [Pleuronectes platessa]|uniref:Uncharacterized protein n=1 Tax=Pleuronectes platessa TaxID=8262 RepID=A0A9N7U6L5_PLEPL|nr:unnamed protein product [Pleuronectes platessa]